MLEVLGSLLSTIFAGGATGLIGVAFKMFGDYKNRQLDLQLAKQQGELELAKRDKDAAIMREEWAGRTAVAKTEGDAQASVAKDQAFAESYKSESTRYADSAWLALLPAWARVVAAFLMFLLDFVRGGVRPALVIYLCVLTTLIFYEARALLDEQPLTPEIGARLVLLIISTLLYLFTTCVTWYFGVRNLQAPPKLTSEQQ